VNLLNWLYDLVAQVILAIHSGLAPIFGASSGWAWGLSIVFLVMLMRLLLFPLFVKQIRTQRQMTVLQPKVKELQQKYKGDRETLNQEMMKLYKEHGANPLTGCLPLVLQLPIFFALFHVLSGIAKVGPDGVVHHTVNGIPAATATSAAHAKIFGAPIAAAFNSPAHLLTALNANATTVKTVALIMMILMGASTFWTQRQLMVRNSANGGTQMASQQKILLYVLPFTFFIFGFRFPIGVLLYWLTTNVWSMGQQHFVINRMNNPAPAPAGPAPSATGTTTGEYPGRTPPPRPRPPAGGATPIDSSRAPATTPPGAANRRPQGGNRNRRNRGRRGGRR
jgi:YidC/Oxa1 family membrane protein insertase